MRQWTAILLTLSIGFSMPTMAQMTLPKNFDLTKQEAVFSYDSIKELLNNMAAQQTHNDDVLLNVLLATPAHKRQYVFPALHDNKGLPKKILSHPEIAVFKGKKPTDLPPRLADFSREYLAYLPTAYYLYLDPDYWKENKKDSSENNILYSLNSQRKIIHTPHRGEFFTFPSVQNLYHLSDITKKNYKKTDLTAQDVSRLFNTVTVLENYLEKHDKTEELEISLLNLLTQNANMAQDLSWPFLSLVNRLKMTRPEGEIEQLFRSQGWKNAAEFAEKSDRILKAYRVNYLDPAVAVQLNKIRAYPENAPTPEALENLRMYAKLHEAAPGDVYFVQPYLKEIRKNLKPDFILKIATPIYME
ncbi:MAG: hypothetical protein J6V11_01360 [Alphaproteobacteria bacterium]|nr:hypothetical protein [Alphaproteobacteria bacterium]